MPAGTAIHMPFNDVLETKRGANTPMAKEWALNTAKLPPGGSPMQEQCGKVTDRPKLTSAVYRGHLALNQTNKIHQT